MDRCETMEVDVAQIKITMVGAFVHVQDLQIPETYVDGQTSLSAKVKAIACEAVWKQNLLTLATLLQKRNAVLRENCYTTFN